MAETARGARFGLGTGWDRSAGRGSTHGTWVMPAVMVGAGVALCSTARHQRQAATGQRRCQVRVDKACGAVSTAALVCKAAGRQSSCSGQAGWLHSTKTACVALLFPGSCAFSVHTCTHAACWSKNAPRASLQGTARGMARSGARPRQPRRQTRAGLATHAAPASRSPCRLHLAWDWPPPTATPERTRMTVSCLPSCCACEQQLAVTGPMRNAGVYSNGHLLD